MKQQYELSKDTGRMNRKADARGYSKRMPRWCHGCCICAVAEGEGLNFYRARTYMRIFVPMVVSVTGLKYRIKVQDMIITAGEACKRNIGSNFHNYLDSMMSHICKRPCFSFIQRGILNASF
jgi:hypothetical protein